MDRLVHFGKDVVSGWLEVDAFTLAAALAYYAIFAIAPLLLISIHIASLFFNRAAAVEGLTNEMIRVIGPAGSGAVKQMLDAAGTAQGFPRFRPRFDVRSNSSSSWSSLLRTNPAGRLREPGRRIQASCTISMYDGVRRSA